MTTMTMMSTTAQRMTMLTMTDDGDGATEDNGDGAMDNDGDDDGKGNGPTDDNGDIVSGNDDNGDVQRVTTMTMMAMDDDDGDSVTDGQ